jgi:protein SCO1
MSSNESSIARRQALLGLALPLAGVLAGCAGVSRTGESDGNGSDSSNDIRGPLGASIKRPDGTRAFRNHELVDQDGQSVRFQTDLIEGRVFAANFMYVRCKGICTDMTARLAAAHELLTPIMGGVVQFYSFSLAEDSPADMKRYMRERGLDTRKGWRFLSGSREAIRDIRWAFGFFEPNEELDLRLDGHTGMARFGNHPLDKWSACPLLGRPEVIARGVLGVLPHEVHKLVPGVDDSHHPIARPIPGWTPARPL